MWLKILLSVMMNGCNLRILEAEAGGLRAYRSINMVLANLGCVTRQKWGSTESLPSRHTTLCSTSSM